MYKPLENKIQLLSFLSIAKKIFDKTNLIAAINIMLKAEPNRNFHGGSYNSRNPKLASPCSSQKFNFTLRLIPQSSAAVLTGEISTTF